MQYKVTKSNDGSYVLISTDGDETQVIGQIDVPEVEAPPAYAVKSLGENRVGAYGILWGDEERKDLHDQWFTKSTEEMTRIFDALGGLPWLFHHAADGVVKTAVIGIVDVLEADETGLWYEAKIREHELYKKYVKPLVDSNALFSSTGTLPMAGRVKKSGEISRWPVAEITGTHTPAEWRMLERPIEEVKKSYKDVDLNLPSFLGEDDEGKDSQIGAVKARQNKLKLFELKLSMLSLEETNQ